MLILRDSLRQRDSVRLGASGAQVGNRVAVERLRDDRASHPLGPDRAEPRARQVVLATRTVRAQHRVVSRAAQ